MAEQPEYFEPTGSSWNTAMAYMDRIATELKEANEHYKAGNLDGWKVNLDVLYREIHPFLVRKKKQN